MVRFIFKDFNSLDTQELYDLLKLRSAVFVVEQDCVYLDMDDLDQQAVHLLGCNTDEKLVAYARILPKDIPYTGYCSIGRIISSSELRGKGLGKEIMEKCLDFCWNRHQGTPIKIMAQYYLLEFYQSFGFTALGEKFPEDGIWHINMVRENE